MSKLLRHIGYFGSRIMAATKLVSVQRGSCSAGERIMTKLSHLWLSTIPSELYLLLRPVARVQRYIKWTLILLSYTVPYRRRSTSNNLRDLRFPAKRIGFAS